MRKFATIAAGTALAAGVVLVPAAGFASAATTHSAAAKAPVTQVHPRDVTAWQCEELGGGVFPDWYSPSGYVCVGGWANGEIVW